MRYILKEKLLLIAGFGVVVSSIYLKKIPTLSQRELQVLLILTTLFIVINGLKVNRAFLIVEEFLKNRFIALKLVATASILSMLFTNDIAITIAVFLTLSLNIEYKGLLVALEMVAVNVASSLLPFGNPQNIFIYWFYKLNFLEFIKEILPFGVVLLSVLVVTLILDRKIKVKKQPPHQTNLNLNSYLFFGLFILIILTILHQIPVEINFIIIALALIFDSNSLKIDYGLIISFLLFFALGENFKEILTSTITHQNHIFLLSLILSQAVSNVPATLIVAKITQNWQGLLWGVSVGGLGGLFGSLSNLIAYRLYLREHKNSLCFNIVFFLVGYLALSIGVAVFYLRSWL